jgi:hypothetical protein
MCKMFMRTSTFPTKSWLNSTKEIPHDLPFHGVGTSRCRPIGLASSSEHMFGFVRGFLASEAGRGQDASVRH